MLIFFSVAKEYKISELLKWYTSVHKNMHVFVQVYGAEFIGTKTLASQ